MDAVSAKLLLTDLLAWFENEVKAGDTGLRHWTRRIKRVLGESS